MWNHYRDEVNDDANGNYAAGNKITTSKSFKYKLKLIGCTPNDNNALNRESCCSIEIFQ